MDPCPRCGAHEVTSLHCMPPPRVSSLQAPSRVPQRQARSLYSRFKRYGPSGFGYGSTAEEVTAGLDLCGKTILVTGVTSGLGLETARVLSMRGARVVGLARTAERARQAMRAMPNDPLAVGCDLADLATVRAAV